MPSSSFRTCLLALEAAIQFLSKLLLVLLRLGLQVRLLQIVRSVRTVDEYLLQPGQQKTHHRQSPDGRQRLTALGPIKNLRGEMSAVSSHGQGKGGN